MPVKFWQTFYIQKFVDNDRQCFAFKPQANFPTHNLNFHWRWWNGSRLQFNFFFYFKIQQYPVKGFSLRTRERATYGNLKIGLNWLQVGKLCSCLLIFPHVLHFLLLMIFHFRCTDINSNDIKSKPNTQLKGLSKAP